MKRGMGPQRFSWGVRLFFLTVLGLTIVTAPRWAAGEEGPETELPQVGDPHAPGMMALLKQEMEAGLKTRKIESKFSRFQSYAAWKLDSTAGPRISSEVTGLCRLRWYDHLLRNPLKAPAEAEEFTRQLHEAFQTDPEGLDRALSMARVKMDCSPREPRTFESVTSPQEALEAVQEALAGAQMGYAAALSPLKRSEVGELARNLVPVFSRSRIGHYVAGSSTGRRLCRLLERLDRNGFYAAAEALVPLTDPQLLAQLGSLSEQGRTVAIAGVAGPVLQHLETSAGTIVIGGRGTNEYQLDQMPEVNVVIDLGGDDVYHEGTVSLKRPVLIVIDLAGNDAYRGSQPGVQGSAVLGISMLIDAAGNDVYRAQDVAQGSCLGGVGILIDRAGNDAYVGVRRVQAQALGGLGMLIDRAGDDRYHAAMWAQGFGGSLGFGVLEDLHGKDHYFAGGLYYDSYPETPGYEGWGQGVGAGLRGSVADGGIGVILDGDGEDVYEFDYLSHGGGYWCGLGFARDFGGNDQRLGATTKTYNGGTRRERRYQRFGNGFGCHYALGFCFDDEGDDVYHGTIMGSGFAWDCSVGVLCDFAGSDRYEATGSSTKGRGAQAGLGVLYDYDGDDSYRGYGQGSASSSISYHSLPQCGGNFSFLVDYGGTDKYGCRAKNNTYNRRVSSGGFLIDRPSRTSETTDAAEAKAAEGTTGSSLR